MNKPLPKFWRRMAWSKVDPALLNNLVEEVERLRNLTAGYGIQLASTEGGVVVSLDPSVFPKPRGEISHVVLVEEPVEESTALVVRVVKFREAPKVDESPYEWAAMEPIEAVPEFGREAVDYKDFLWSSEDEPTTSTSFLKLQHRYKGRRVVWFPSKGAVFTFAVVRSVGEGTELFVHAQAVRWTGSSWRFVGDAVEVATYPGVASKYYEPFVWLGEEVSLPDTPLLRVFSADGEVWIEQSIRWATRMSSGNINLSDCTPVEQIT